MKLYVVTGPGGTKVGCSEDPVARLQYFIRHERSRRLERLVQTWDLGNLAKEVEYTVCQIVPSDRAHGLEQFTIDPDAMVVWVEKAIKMVRSGNGVERPFRKIKRRKSQEKTFREIVDLLEAEYGIECSPQTVMVTLKREQKQR